MDVIIYDVQKEVMDSTVLGAVPFPVYYEMILAFLSSTKDSNLGPPFLRYSGVYRYPVESPQPRFPWFEADPHSSIVYF